MLLPSRQACLVLALFAFAACNKPKEEKPSTASTTAAGGKYTFVSLKPAQGDLAQLLAAEVKKARADGKKPFAEIGATWCPPCKKLDASMGDPRMIEAFEGTYVIKLDQDAWEAQLGKAGLKSSAIPVFFELGDDGKPTGRKIDGGAWEEDIPANMAPPLKKFFHAS